MAQDYAASPPNPPITKIEDNLYLGDGISSRRRPILEEHNISAVVSLAVGRWVHWRQPWYREIVPTGRHLFIPCNDSMTHDLLPELARICDFIQGCRDDQPRSDSGVLVHCDKGISRSPTVLVAYLMRLHGWSLETPLAFVKEKRRVRPNENFMEQLQVWEVVEYEIWQDEDGKVPKAEYAAYLGRRAERLKKQGLTGDEPIGIEEVWDYTRPSAREPGKK